MQLEKLTSTNRDLGLHRKREQLSSMLLSLFSSQLSWTLCVAYTTIRTTFRTNASALDITPQYGAELLGSLVFLTIPLASITKLSITSPPNSCPTSTTGRFLPSSHLSTPKLLAHHKRTASAEWERERERDTHTHRGELPKDPSCNHLGCKWWSDRRFDYTWGKEVDQAYGQWHQQFPA